MALITVCLPFVAKVSLPAEVMYQKPPKIKNRTAIAKVIERIQPIALSINWLASVVRLQLIWPAGQLKPVSPKAAKLTKGANAITETTTN